MVPFNTVSMPDDSFTSDGLNFSANEPFLLICNKPIPKNKKVYFEFSISSYTPNKNRRNLPIYAGIHKEPSFGVLNSDFCIGSLFYNAGDNYKVMEKHVGDSNISDVSTVYTRLPGSTDIIGVAVDSYNNIITLYVNGKAFYSFSPTLFNMNNDNEGNFYVCLWSNISCDLIGTVNFGKTYTNYLPTGFMNIYSYYYKQIDYISDIEGSVVVASKGTKYNNFITGDLTVINSIAADRQFNLISKASNVNISSSTMASMNAKTTNNYLYNGANIFLNMPLPTNAKVYFEVLIKNASNLSNIIGIPISVGIANITSSILSMSTRIPLYHTQWHHYTFTEVKNLIPTDYTIEDVETSLPNEEGKIIGIAIDLANNSMTIFVNRIEFYTLKTVNNNFNSLKFLSYFFIHDEGAFTGTASITFNYGATSFIGTIPDGYISLYNYYNASYIESIYSDIVCDLYHPDRLTKEMFIYGDVTVDYPTTDASNSFTNLGINKLMNTYNTISDKEQPVTADKDISFLNNIVNEMAYYHVSITQTPHQTIIVTCGKNSYIDSFYTSYNTPYTVTLKHDKGYQPGILNTRTGYITSDIDIYASGAIKYTANIINDITCDISAGIHMGDWDIDSDITLMNDYINSDIDSTITLEGASETPGELTGDITLLSDPINKDLPSDFNIAYTFFIRFINIADLTLVMRDFEQYLMDGDVDIPYQLVQMFAMGSINVQHFDINYLIQSTTAPNFSRASIATMNDGSTVTNNIPRIQNYSGVTNLISNGNFSNGMAGWGNNYHINYAIESNILYYTPNQQYAGFTENISNFLNYANHELYFRAYYKTDSALNYLVLNYGTGQTTVNHPGDGNWHSVSGLCTLPSNLTGLNIKIQDFRTSGWTETQCTNFIVIDLTAIYGSGNEPILSTCDSLYANWWDQFGIMIEESTVNYTSPSQVKSYNGGTLSTSVYYSVSGTKIIATNQRLSSYLPGWKISINENQQIVINGKTNAPTVNFWLQGYNSSGGILITNRTIRTATPTSGNFSFTKSMSDFSVTGLSYINIGIGCLNSSNYYLDVLQTEIKAYSTSFIDGTRDTEQLTIPASCLNYQQGEIQFDWMPINGFNNYSSIMYIGDYATANNLILRLNGNTSPTLSLLAQGNTNNGWSVNESTSIAIDKEIQHRIVISWKNANTLFLIVDGVPVISNATMKNAFTSMGNLIFGNNPYVMMQSENIKNLRISNTFHTTTQQVADYLLTSLPVLIDTTYSLPATSDLTATYAATTLHDIPSDITLSNDYINKDLASDITLTKWSFNTDLSCDLTLSAEPAYNYNGKETYNGFVPYDT